MRGSHIHTVGHRLRRLRSRRHPPPFPAPTSGEGPHRCAMAAAARPRLACTSVAVAKEFIRRHELVRAVRRVGRVRPVVRRILRSVRREAVLSLKLRAIVHPHLLDARESTTVLCSISGHIKLRYCVWPRGFAPHFSARRTAWRACQILHWRRHFCRFVTRVQNLSDTFATAGECARSRM